MKIAVLLSSLLVAACSSTPSMRPSNTESGPMAAAGDPFPVPTAGLSLAAGTGKDTLSLQDVLNDFQRVTGLHIVVSPESAGLLMKTSAGLSQPLEIPASRVYSTVETLLIEASFGLTMLQTDKPVILGVVSMYPGARTAQPWTPHLTDLGLVANHPALIVSVPLTLNHLDARQVVNEMRQQFQDPRTQQIMPFGDGNTLLLTGPGRSVSAMAEIVTALDEAEGRAQAERAKHPRETDQPKSDKPTPK